MKMKTEKQKYKKERDDFIRNIVKEKPNMKVLYVNGKGINWTNEKIIKELNQKEKDDFNLRKQFDDEITLDLEEPYRLSEVISKLKDKNYSYEVWETGSRGFHISLRFSNIKNLELELKDRVRKYVIDYFNTDLRLAKQSQWLALEYTPHFKTGNIKTLIESVKNEKENELNEEIIEYCKKDLETQKQKQYEIKQVIKDFHKNDPYLNFVLNNIIEHGDRNNILFKNLAIGLVQGGLSRDEIIPYAQKIIQNCPGKTVGEFMGWVDKSLSGELNDFNKQELCQWSIDRGEKPLYKLFDDKDILDMMNIKQLWDEIWNNNITSQNVWKDLCFYNLLSAVLKEKEKDLRIHVIFAAFSSSGKDEGVNLVREVLERMNYKVKVPNTVTDRTLVGAVNQSKMEYNIKWGLDEDNPIDSKGRQYKDPKEEGWLATTDWMACPESEFIIKPGAYNRNIQSIFRQAMDKAKKIDKGVGGEEITIDTNTVFNFTTYSMGSKINEILHNGLFQRALFYNKDVTQKDHERIRSYMVMNRFNSKSKVKYDKELYFSKLITKLKNLKSWWDENKKEIDFDDECKEYTNRMIINLEQEYQNMIKMDIKLLNSMLRRSIENLYRLSILSTIYKKKTKVKIEDIKEGFDLMRICLGSIRHLVINQDENKKVKYGICRLLMDGSQPTMKLYKVIEENLGVTSPNKQKKIITQLEKLEFINYFKTGNTRNYYITEKGKLFVEEGAD